MTSPKRSIPSIEGTSNRRQFVQQATVTGISAGAAAMIARSVVAQDATPEATPAGEMIPSVTRDQFLSSLKQKYPIEPATSAGGQVFFASTADIASTHPHVYGDVASTWVVGPMFSTLVGGSPVDGTIVPDLADSWDTAADGLTYTFYLNRNATFHDGTPVTTADVVFSFDSILNELSPSLSRGGVIQLLKSYRAIDDHTFEITALSASSLFLSKVPAAVAIVPKHIWEAIPVENWGESPGSTGEDPAMVIGSGAFKFVERVGSDHITIARNDKYFVPELIPTIDTFTLRVIPEAASTIQALQTGEIDITLVPTAQADSLQTSNPDLVINVSDTWGFTYLIPNLHPEKGTFFKDLATRQALYYALDREALLDAILFGYGVIANGPQPPLSPAYAPDKLTTHFSYDPEKAKSLLEEAGWVDSDGDGVRERDGVVFAIRLVFYDLDRATTQALTYVQQALGEVGIQVEVVPVKDAIVDAFTNADFDLSYTTIFWTADGDQGAIFRCDAAFPDGFNLSFWCNPEYDALDDQQLVELDRPTRIEILEQMSDIVNEDVPYVILYYPQEIAGSSARLRNFYPNGYSLLWSLNFVWIDESA